MSTSFSWTDTALIALSSCLPCFPNTAPTEINPKPFNRIPRAGPDELQGLLVPAGEGSDTDAERMSLHSNPSRAAALGSTGKRNRKRYKKRKKMTLFGIDLFGGPSDPPIHLPESDDEEGLARGERRRERRALSASSSTFDSDAPVLDSSTIAHISFGSDSPLAPTPQALPEFQEERRQRKERRRLEKAQRRDERRARKAFELHGGVGGEFEGFPGSGGGGEGTVLPPPTAEPAKPRTTANDEDDDEEDGQADFDGRFYALRSGSGKDNGSGSRSGSDSRSKTTTTTTGSRQAELPHNHPSSYTTPDPQHLRASKPAPKKPSTTHGSSTSTSASRTSASRSSRSVGSSSTSQSSPVSPTFSLSPPAPNGSKSRYRSKLGRDTSVSTHTSTPTHVDRELPTGPYTDASAADAFDGTQGLSEADIPITPSPTSPRLPRPSSNGFRPGDDSGTMGSMQDRANNVDGFPSTGFGLNASRMNRSNSILARGGAFLATRGD